MGTEVLPRSAKNEDNDLEPLLVDMQRRVRFAALPNHPIVIRFEIDRRERRFMLLKAAEASLCMHNPGFPELCVRSRLSALVSWWRGDASFVEAQRMGLSITGPKALVRVFPEWFNRYQFAEIGPVVQKADKNPIARSKTGHTLQCAATQIARPS